MHLSGTPERTFSFLPKKCAHAQNACDGLILSTSRPQWDSQRVQKHHSYLQRHIRVIYCSLPRGRTGSKKIGKINTLYWPCGSLRSTCTKWICNLIRAINQIFKKVHLGQCRRVFSGESWLHFGVVDSCNFLPQRNSWKSVSFLQWDFLSSSFVIAAKLCCDHFCEGLYISQNGTLAMAAAWAPQWQTPPSLSKKLFVAFSCSINATAFLILQKPSMKTTRFHHFHSAGKIPNSKEQMPRQRS